MSQTTAWNKPINVGKKQQVLNALKKGPQSNRDLAKITSKYTGIISALRREPYNLVIDIIARNHVSGLVIYKIIEPWDKVKEVEAVVTPSVLPLAAERCWLVDSEHWDYLHRLAKITYHNQAQVSGLGTALCGLSADFFLPGLFTLTNLERCPYCCQHLAIPYGRGNPAYAAPHPKH